MQAVIQANKVFELSAELRQVQAVRGTFSLTFSSTFSGAKGAEPRVVYQTTLDPTGLLALRDLIDRELAACD